MLTGAAAAAQAQHHCLARPLGLTTEEARLRSADTQTSVSVHTYVCVCVFVCARARDQVQQTRLHWRPHKFAMVHAACSNGHGSGGRGCSLVPPLLPPPPPPPLECSLQPPLPFSPPVSLPHLACSLPRKPFFFIPFVCMRRERARRERTK